MTDLDALRSAIEHLDNMLAREEELEDSASLLANAAFNEVQYYLSAARGKLLSSRGLFREELARRERAMQ